MNRKICDVLVTIYISFLLIYLVIGNVFRLYKMYTTMEIALGLVYFGALGVIIYFLYKVINRVKLDIYDWLIFLLIIFGIISVVCAIDSDVALSGFRGRYEGFLQIVTYYVLFLNCKNMDNKICKKILIWLIIVLGCIQALYSVLQFSDIKQIFDYSILIKRNRFYSTGFEVNPNFLGTVMVVTLSLSLGIYFTKKNIVISLLTLITSTVLFFGMLCSGAMSATIAMFSVLFVLILLFILWIKDWRFIIVKFFLLFLLFGVIYNQYNKYDKGYYLSQIKKSSYEIGETFKGDAAPIYGSGRIHIWRETLKIVPDNLLNGVGIDNFYYAFGKDEKLIDVKSKLPVDKAHNEYLQKLVTEGIFSFLTYMILIFMIFIKSIFKIFKFRYELDFVIVILFLGFVSYCVQAFFNISVISVAPLFYIIMGLLCSLVKKVENEKIRD